MLTGEDDLIVLSYGGVTINTVTGVVTPGDDYFEVRGVLAGNGLLGYDDWTGATETRDAAGAIREESELLPSSAMPEVGGLWVNAGSMLIEAQAGPSLAPANSTYPYAQAAGGALAASPPRSRTTAIRRSF